MNEYDKEILGLLALAIALMIFMVLELIWMASL